MCFIRPCWPHACCCQLDSCSCILSTWYYLVFWFMYVLALWLWLGPIGHAVISLCVCGEASDFILVFLMDNYHNQFYRFLINYLGLSDTCYWHFFIIYSWVVVVGARITRGWRCWTDCLFECVLLHCISFICLWIYLPPLCFVEVCWITCELVGPWADFRNANMFAAVVICYS